jgi:energy-coupling factor transport system permease protein
VVATIGALALGGYVAPTALVATLVVPEALAARVARRTLITAAIVTAPLAVAVSLVSILTLPGTTVLFVVGPFDATLEGVDLAARVMLRLFVMAAALTLFGRTTPARSLVADLERRGISPRLAFAVANVLDAVPAMLERARNVVDAQRARGLDTDASVMRRVASVVPLIGPVVIGALHQVETRSLALEARAFGRPGRRHLLWAPADTGIERVVRWLLVAGLLIVVAGTVAGTLPRLP